MTGSEAQQGRKERDFSITRARAPLRLGFAGGGTDLSPYCDEYGGAVLNFTIDRFAYAFIEGRTDDRLHFRAMDLNVQENFAVSDLNTSKIKLRLHRAVVERMSKEFCGGNIQPMTITTTVDVPAGSGLGSSSALVVALVEAFRAYFGLPLGKYDVAHLAFEIERHDLRLSGGKQDQYAAAFGGANFIEFLAGDRVIVNPLRVPSDITLELESSLVMCFSGRSRDSALIIDQQVTAMVDRSVQALEALHALKADAVAMKRALLRGDLGEMAQVLNRSWEAKKATASAVSNPMLDDLFNLARQNGALAGKVSGAGGGGFMMFIVTPEDRSRLIDRLSSAGAVASPVKFTADGCESWHSPASISVHHRSPA